LRPDRKYPSIVFATCPAESHDLYPVIQELIYNDGGKLVHKWLGAYPVTNTAGSVSAYPMRALGLDCAWIQTSDLPVCFFASMEDGALGVSRLIAMDPGGYEGLVADSATRAQYSWAIDRRLEGARRLAQDSKVGARDIGSARRAAQLRLGLDSAALEGNLAVYLPGPTAAASDTLLAAVEWVSRAGSQQRARSYMGWMDQETLDSALTAVGIRDPAAPVDYLLAVALSQLDRTTLFSRDLTREYQLPWPAQMGHGRPNPDGMFMMGAAFLDFTGDGLLDLVVVGQHSRPFSAIQHPDGYFVQAGFHSTPDDYVRAWAPKTRGDPGGAVPPCVYFGMEKTEEEAWRSDYVECYDQAAAHWYEVSLPDGPYWTEYERVVFWDMNGDGNVDFAARTDQGAWNVLTFVREQPTASGSGQGGG
jgi:hypothetical protein